MDLSFLIPSAMRRRVLEYFCTNPEAKIHVRELAREFNAAPQLVYRELINMENWGFLLSYRQGNQRVYTANQKFVFRQMIVDLFKMAGQVDSMTFEVNKVYDWQKLSKKYDKVPVDEKLQNQLVSKRTRPRAYSEDAMLKRKNLL